MRTPATGHHRAVRDRSGRSRAWLTAGAAAVGAVGTALVLLVTVGGPNAPAGADLAGDAATGPATASASPIRAAQAAEAEKVARALEAKADSAGHDSSRSMKRAVLPAYRVQQASPPLKRKPVEKTVSSTVRVGTLNVLGSNHTHHSKQWAPGVARTAREASAIEARGIDVIGLQEMQTDQIAVLQRDLGAYDMWPATALGPNGYRLQVAWRSDRFELVDTGTIATVFNHIRGVPLPWVELRSRETGGEFYFVTLHNSPRDMEGERDAATGTEIGLFNQLLATGLPVVVVGDTNETYEFYCRVAPATGMAALNGSSVAGGCRVPHPSGLDWVLGGARDASFSFSGYHREAMPGMSDHPIVFGDATISTTILRDPVSGRIVE